MAYYTQIASPSLSERALAWMAHKLEETAVRHARYRVYRTSLNELRALSDRELCDLGMNRTMLKSIASEAADNYLSR